MGFLWVFYFGGWGGGGGGCLFFPLSFGKCSLREEEVYAEISML